MAQGREDLKEGTKYDNNGDKLRYDLLPPDGIQELVRVYTAGAIKYADRNWEKGIKYSRILGANKRHLADREFGILIDPDTGCHHMAAAVWNSLALLTYDLRGMAPDWDDLPRILKGDTFVQASQQAGSSGTESRYPRVHVVGVS